MAIRLKNGKYDLNSMGAMSTDYIGANWDYPAANNKRRAEIAQEHYKYEAGLLYFLAHDPSVPKYLQDGFNEFGLCKDEFTDTNNWPRQLYVREVRRMVGDYVLTQHDIQDNRTKADSIGVASYQIDSHNIQRVVRPDGGIENEGDIYTPVKPYDISYRTLYPRRAEATNLLVPVCLSSSHVGYSSIRQEPDYMILGQASGVAAAIAAKKSESVQDVAVGELQERLTAQKVILHWPEPASK